MGFASGPDSRLSGEHECAYAELGAYAELAAYAELGAEENLMAAAYNRHIATIALGLMAMPALSACSADPRIEAAPDGTVPYAPFRNTLDAEPALGAPQFSADIPKPGKGIIETAQSYGSSTTYVFDADAGLLTGVWSDPDLSGSGGNPPIVQKHQFKLAKDERTGLTKLANIAWDPRHATVRTAGMQDSSSTIWLLDGGHYKAIDGNGAGQAIAAALLLLANKHGVARDDHER
jgi:hypothetical protein